MIQSHLHMSTKDHNFNWVQALDEFSVNNQFDLMRKEVKELTKLRQAQLPDKSGQIQLAFLWFTNRKAFQVEVLRDLMRGPETWIFELHIGMISFSRVGTVAAPGEYVKITTTMNDDGECRFQIDGSGSYLRWQVLRHFLEPLFYPGR